MKLLFSSLFAAILMVAADAPKPLPPVPVSVEDRQLLEQAVADFNAAQKHVQTLSEIVRLRSCLTAGVTLAECGPWNTQGQIVRMPKPELPKETKKP